MSSPYSKYLVAVTVDQRIIRKDTIPPAMPFRSANTASQARKVHGSREYPTMLMVL